MSDTTPTLRAFDRPADRIRFHRQANSDPIVVVEGIKDKRVIERLLGEGTVAVFPVGTRNSVLQIASALAVAQIKKIAYVVDRDFDDVVSVSEATNPAIATYDSGDLEAMLFESAALDSFLGEFAAEDKLISFGGPQAVRTACVDEAMTISRLRRANAIGSWGFNFDAVDVSDKVRDGAIRVQPFIDALVSVSPGSSGSREQLVVAVADSEPVCPNSGCRRYRGRDALAIVAVLLRRKIASLSKQATSVDSLERVLRLSVNVRDLSGTSWMPKIVQLLELSPKEFAAT